MSATSKSKIIVSDIHAMDREEPNLFNAAKEAIFVGLARQALESRASFVLAGDIFDLTGLSPCRRAHRAFFDEAVPPNLLDRKLADDSARPRTTAERLEAIRARFPAMFAALGELARAKLLVYLPGNHDCAFGAPEGRLAFERAIGGSEVEWRTEVVSDDLLIASHGNEFDRDNRTAHGCSNRGLIFTQALYRGVLPALGMLGVPRAAVDALPAVRPEEEVIAGLAHYLDEEAIRRLLLALARLLQRNGFFHGRAAIPAWFLAHDLPVISPLMKRGVTAKRIKSILPKEDVLIHGARRGAEILRARAGRPNALVVLGHTHELDLQPDYVNLGTWIDHVTALTPEAIASPDRRIPALWIAEDGSARLTDARDGRELWSRGT